jgi:hypothetical protein
VSPPSRDAARLPISRGHAWDPIVQANPVDAADRLLSNPWTASLLGTSSQAQPKQLSATFRQLPTLPQQQLSNGAPNGDQLLHSTGTGQSLLLPQHSAPLGTGFSGEPAGRDSLWGRTAVMPLDASEGMQGGALGQPAPSWLGHAQVNSEKQGTIWVLHAGP